MARILISGLINLETTLQIEAFPVTYTPVRYPFFGVQSTVSGVGYNLTKALHTLGDTVDFLSLTGTDPVGQLVRQAFVQEGLPEAGVLALLDQTPQSVILYDTTGRRQIHVDLKDVQERTYPPEPAARALAACEVAVLCNANFSRPLLAAARAAGKLVATDVHAIRDLEDAYNMDFMRQADILFLSHEALPEAPEAWARAAQNRYGNAIIVVGLGGQGALLCTREDGRVEHFPAALLRRPVRNTIGAGDALFACFLHEYARSGNAREALRRAQIFAAWKIGVSGAAAGFLTAAQLDELASQ